jgi:small subunit ribosomal protein SAe
MSQVPEALRLQEDDVEKMLAADVHRGSENLEKAMEKYMWKRRPDGPWIINLAQTWEKLVVAARVIVAIENPRDVIVISGRQLGQRAVMKFGQYTGCQAISGRYTPGTFTNQMQKGDFREPRLLVVTDPRVDSQPLTEASYVNIPTIAFCHSDSPIRNVDVAVPANNTGKHSIGLLYWLLCREVLRLRGTLDREKPWDVMPDMFFWRNPDEELKDDLDEEEEEFEDMYHADESETPTPGIAGQPDWPIEEDDDYQAPTYIPGEATPSAEPEDDAAQPPADWGI